MSDTDAVHAVRTSVAALNDGDIDGYLSGFSPACLRWVSGLDEPRTLDDMRSDIIELHRAIAPVHLDEDLLFGADRFVCARWRLVGVHSGSYFGIEATGNEISMQNCEVYEYDGTQVVAVWTYGNPLELLRELGAVPEPGATS